ncbi:MAG TPA: hypothetical protein VKH45_14145 [Candidatus Acidoferrum sp.]|nr:hypothetical protein [Candidatus Acidoferrum sp.]
MKAVSAPGAKSPVLLDFRKSLLQSFAINERANQLLISNIGDRAWQAGCPTGKGRSIADVAVHIHHVRLMWLSAADQTAKCRGN